MVLAVYLAQAIVVTEHPIFKGDSESPQGHLHSAAYAIRLKYNACGIDSCTQTFSFKIPWHNFGAAQSQVMVNAQIELEFSIEILCMEGEGERRETAEPCMTLEKPLKSKDQELEVW